MRNKFNWLDIDLRGRTSGKFKTLCPVCNKGKKDYSLSVDLSDGISFCHRCESVSNRESTKGESLPYYIPPSEAKPISIIDSSLVGKTLKGYDNNPFVKSLGEYSEQKKVYEVVYDYKVGTSKKYGGSPIFWQIDYWGNVRTGKVMGYDNTLHRTGYQNWIHSLLKYDNFNLSQCFFGERLLYNNNKPVNVVESEKTAILGALNLDKYVWLASGGSGGLTDEKCKILKGRNVTLFPDNDHVYDKWKLKADQYGFEISDIVKGHHVKGYDVGDWILDIKKEFKEAKVCLDLNMEPITEEESDKIIIELMGYHPFKPHLNKLKINKDTIP